MLVKAGGVSFSLTILSCYQGMDPINRGLAMESLGKLSVSKEDDMEVYFQQSAGAGFIYHKIALWGGNILFIDIKSTYKPIT